MASSSASARAAMARVWGGGGRRPAHQPFHSAPTSSTPRPGARRAPPAHAESLAAAAHHGRVQARARRRHRAHVPGACLGGRSVALALPPGIGRGRGAVRATVAPISAVSNGGPCRRSPAAPLLPPRTPAHASHTPQIPSPAARLRLPAPLLPRHPRGRGRLRRPRPVRRRRPAGRLHRRRQGKGGRRSGRGRRQRPTAVLHPSTPLPYTPPLPSSAKP